MKLNAMLVVPALLGALLLTACGEKAEEAAAPAEAPMEAAPAAEAPMEAAPAPTTAGGYEPTAEERVPGITVDPAAAPAEAPMEAPMEAAPAAAE
ncbi:MAG: hypothetical protein CTY37_06205 [Methylotenera sp.]|nr:MAG: hypothetical protein CTY37_06205 [Methylotenera sp.]PPD15013.1 MAG: hypothetical protein CTY27_05875 [Methylotenera sp.]